jgi:DNA repair protein RecN (Recombination protein N)
MEQLMQHASAAVMLVDGEEAGTPGLRDVLGQLELDGTAVARLDAGMSDWLSRLQEQVYQFEDLAREIRRYQEALEFDPDRLAQLEERLEVLNRLKRKYGRDIPGIIAYRQEAADELDGITHSDDRIKALQAQEQEMLARLGEQAQALSQRRQAVAAQLAQDVVGELADLRMEDARFAFDFDWVEEEKGAPVGDRRLAFDESGIDRGEFLISANPGEPLKPLAKVASGGETARLMLALKTALARVDQTPTLIFDEIDQGIGGRVGDIVGRKLWELARNGGHQVIVVTHLPQLAGYGDAHFQVDKEVSAGRTRTLVQALDDHARVTELAAMLGTHGANAGEGAEAILQHAASAKSAALNDTVG